MAEEKRSKEMEEGVAEGKPSRDKEEGVRFNIEEKPDLPAGDEESVMTDPELEATLPPIAPRPSITAAIRRGSYYGDVTPHISIMDVLSESEAESDWTERSSSSTAGSAHTEEVLSIDDADDEESLSNKFRVYMLGFLEGMLERLSLLAALPGATSIIDTSVDLRDVPDGIQVLAEKKELLDAANLIHFSLGTPSKLSKFTIETTWLTDVLTTVRKEVLNSSTFSELQCIMDKDELKMKSLPTSIAHVKELKDKMNMLNVLIEAEAQTHQEAVREWAKNIAVRKKELKELRADNLVQYRYKADTSLATGDLCRRDYEVRLINLRADNVRLKHDLEVHSTLNWFPRLSRLFLSSMVYERNGRV